MCGWCLSIGSTREDYYQCEIHSGGLAGCLAGCEEYYESDFIVSERERER